MWSASSNRLSAEIRCRWSAGPTGSPGSLFRDWTHALWRHKFPQPGPGSADCSLATPSVAQKQIRSLQADKAQVFGSCVGGAGRGIQEDYPRPTPPVPVPYGREKRREKESFSPSKHIQHAARVGGGSTCLESMLHVISTCIVH